MLKLGPFGAPFLTLQFRSNAAPTQLQHLHLQQLFCTFADDKKGIQPNV